MEIVRTALWWELLRESLGATPSDYPSAKLLTLARQINPIYTINDYIHPVTNLTSAIQRRINATVELVMNQVHVLHDTPAFYPTADNQRIGLSFIVWNITASSEDAMVSIQVARPNDVRFHIATLANGGLLQLTYEQDYHLLAEGFRIGMTTTQSGDQASVTVVEHRIK